MLTHTQDIKGKLKEKVENAIDDIKMSKFLATIRTDVPIELNLTQLELSTPDEEILLKIFNELEFKTLANKFLKESKTTKKPVNAQLNLFEEFTSEGQE